jgi:hypothetical protein
MAFPPTRQHWEKISPLLQQGKRGPRVFGGEIWRGVATRETEINADGLQDG